MGYVYWIFHSAKITVLAYVRSSKGFRIFLLFIVMYFLCSPPSLDGFLVCLVSVSGVEQTGEFFALTPFFFFFALSISNFDLCFSDIFKKLHLTKSTVYP